MKIMVSKVMQKEIKKNIKSAAYCVEDVYYVEMSEREYRSRVDSFDFWGHLEDWVASKGKYKVLAVEYKSDCCAPDRFVTSRDLREVFHRCDGTYDGFFRALNNEVAI